jgi:hypothetical protein
MKGKNKLVKSQRLSGLDGVRDVVVGKAGVESRQKRDFSKSGKASQRDDSGFADVDAREKRFGFRF